jgi:uncharacterized protein with HEPN domain
MSSRSDRDLLSDILEALRRARSYTEGFRMFRKSFAS